MHNPGRLQQIPMSAIDMGNFVLLLELRRSSKKGRAMHAYSKKEHDTIWQLRGDGSAWVRRIGVRGTAGQKSHWVSASVLSILKLSFEGWWMRGKESTLCHLCLMKTADWSHCVLLMRKWWMKPQVLSIGSFCNVVWKLSTPFTESDP